MAQRAFVEDDLRAGRLVEIFDLRAPTGNGTTGSSRAGAPKRQDQSFRGLDRQGSRRFGRGPTGVTLRINSAWRAPIGLTVSLQGHGLAVARQGTFLVWRDQLVQFDAPCSGVNMLWAGLLLTLMGCVLLRSGVLKVMAAIALSLVLVIAGNVSACLEPVLCRGWPRPERSRLVARRHRHRRIRPVGDRDPMGLGPDSPQGGDPLRALRHRADTRLSSCCCCRGHRRRSSTDSRCLQAPPARVLPAGPRTMKARAERVATHAARDRIYV